LAVVFFLLDAFRYDYMSKKYSPFLQQCAENGLYIQRVVPNFGFCERSEILTGQNPAITGYFTAIGYDPQDSPFKNLRFLCLWDFFESLIPKNKYYKYYRRKLAAFLRKYTEGMSIYNIPFSFLPYFSLTEDKIDHCQKGAFSIPSILERIEENNKFYYYNSFTALNMPPNGPDSNRLRLALDAADEGYDLYLVFISMPDALGHGYGPLSNELLGGMRRMDEMLENFYQSFEVKRPGSTYIFLGDHGMVPVQEYLDVEIVLKSSSKRMGLALHKDYIYFLDSTLCRVWFLSDKARSKFAPVLKDNSKLNDKGVFVDEKLASVEKIPWGDRRYGDLIWWAKPGILIHPDFFHRVEKLKGMHGYDPNIVESQGTCIVFGKHKQAEKREKMHLTDTYHIISGELGL